MGGCGVLPEPKCVTRALTSTGRCGSHGHEPEPRLVDGDAQQQHIYRGVAAEPAPTASFTSFSIPAWPPPVDIRRPPPTRLSDFSRNLERPAGTCDRVQKNRSDRLRLPTTTATRRYGVTTPVL